MALERRPAVVAALGTAQTLAWASSYYLVAILAAPMAAELGVATPTVFAAFSGAMVVSAIVGPWAGRLIDRHGGRPVLVATNLLFATALALLEEVLAAMPGAVYIDLADRHLALLPALVSRGFVLQRPFTRMVHGATEAPGDPARLVLMAGPELG